MSADLRDAIRRHITASQPRPGTVVELADDYPLIDSGLLDSLAVFNLVAFLEEAFDVLIPDEDLVHENFVDLRAVAGLVALHREGRR